MQSSMTETKPLSTLYCPVNVDDPNQRKSLCCSFEVTDDDLCFEMDQFVEKNIDNLNKKFIKPEWDAKDWNSLPNIWKLLKLAMDMTVNDYKEICSSVKKEELTREGLFFNFMIIDSSRNNELISHIVKCVDTNIFNKGIGFGTTLWDYILDSNPFVENQFLKGTDIIAIKIEKIRTLLDLGANVNLANHFFVTPLESAAEHKVDISILQYLILSGGKFYKPLENGVAGRVAKAEANIESAFNKSKFLLLEIEGSYFNWLPKELKQIISYECYNLQNSICF